MVVARKASRVWPKCPRCKCHEIKITEVWESYITWTPYTERDKGCKQPGGPVSVLCECGRCGHVWRKNQTTQVESKWWKK